MVCGGLLAVLLSRSASLPAGLDYFISMSLPMDFLFLLLLGFFLFRRFLPLPFIFVLRLLLGLLGLVLAPLRRHSDRTNSPSYRVTLPSALQAPRAASPPPPRAFLGPRGCESDYPRKLACQSAAFSNSSDNWQPPSPPPPSPASPSPARFSSVCTSHSISFASAYFPWSERQQARLATA